MVIYRPPGQSLATFLEELDGLLSSFVEDGTPLLLCHRSAYPVPFPITVHALTWFHSSLIEHTCNHLPPPFISSLTSVTHWLVLRLQRSTLVDVCPSILGTRLCRWTRKFTNSWYCSSCFQNFLHCLSSVGSPSWVTLINSLLICIYLSVSFDQYRDILFGDFNIQLDKHYATDFHSLLD